jgi:hypothetical protein
VALLVARLQDAARTEDLDRIDANARITHTWGSSSHRQARDRREREYDASCAAYERLSETALDEALAASERSP